MDGPSDPCFLFQLSSNIYIERDGTRLRVLGDGLAHSGEEWMGEKRERKLLSVQKTLKRDECQGCREEIIISFMSKIKAISLLLKA